MFRVHELVGRAQVPTANAILVGILWLRRDDEQVGWWDFEKGEKPTAQVLLTMMWVFILAGWCPLVITVYGSSRLFAVLERNLYEGEAQPQAFYSPGNVRSPGAVHFDLESSLMTHESTN